MIGIICAMTVEAEGLIALCNDTKTDEIYGMSFTSGKMHGRDVVIVVCGVGKVNAAMCTLALIERYKPTAIINSGVAGAVSPLVTVGNLVVAEKSVEHDMNTTALGDGQGEVSFADGAKTYFECDKNISEKLFDVCKSIPETKAVIGTVASGDIFISDRRKRLRINERFGAVACEMEGAAIGHVCFSCGVPYGILRAISDDLDENKGMDFLKFKKLASEKTVQAISRFLMTY